MSKKHFCNSCGSKTGQGYRFMRFKQDMKIYCEVCVSDIAEQEMNKFISEEFEEVNKC